jgi:hypothetical protein
MNDPTPNVERISNLAAAICDEMASREDLVELDAALLADELSRRRYLKYCRLHVSLEMEMQASVALDKMQGRCDFDSAVLAPWEADVLGNAFPSAAPNSLSSPGFFGAMWSGPIGLSSLGWPVAYLIATIIFGIGLLVGAFTYVSHPTHVAQQSASRPSRLSTLPSVVGRITGMIDCKWNGDAVDLNNVSLGHRYELASGLMKITYNTGAKVVLQGPATFTVDSQNGGFLALGKLTARVEKRAEGRGRKAEDVGNTNSALPLPPSALFSVRTPTAIVTDIGTEFGVEVTKDSKTISHVFRGEVEVRSVAANGKPMDTVIRLKANESAQVENNDGGEPATMHPISLDPAAFVQVDQFTKLTQEPRLKPLRRWQAYGQKLCQDPALAVYYDFQRDDKRPNVLDGVSNQLHGSVDGLIEGAKWTAGHLSGKQALDFDGNESRVKIRLPGTLKQMTIATWVAIASINESYWGCCLIGNDWANDKCLGAWQITPDGRFAVGGTIHSCLSITSVLLPWQERGIRRWRHLAVVIDPPNEHAACYVDGQKVYEAKAPTDAASRFESANIGNWWGLNQKYERGLCGRMDEFVILARAMTDQEIQEMYEAGKP